jgi:hypothetical protein
MTKDEIVEHMWKVASNNPNHDTNWYDPVIVTFAKLVAAQEREACAKVCDHMASRCNDIRVAALESAAENIRARGQA